MTGTKHAATRKRCGPFDFLVMLEVGAFHPAWGDIHLGPGNALQALALLGGGAFLPVHWGTFALAMHDWDEPAETLLALGPKQGARLLMPRLGEGVEPGPEVALTAWWRTGETPAHTRSSAVQTEPAQMPRSVPWPLD